MFKLHPGKAVMEIYPRMEWTLTNGADDSESSSSISDELSCQYIDG